MPSNVCRPLRTKSHKKPRKITSSAVVSNNPAINACNKTPAFGVDFISISETKLFMTKNNVIQTKVPKRNVLA